MLLRNEKRPSQKRREATSRYLQLKQGKAEKMRSEYLAILYGFNNWKDYKIGGRKIKAKIIGIDEIGNLLVAFENGKNKSFSLKEISFLF